MSWKRDGLVIWRPIKALLYADKDAFYWFKNKLGLSEYQMAALVWVKGLVVAQTVHGDGPQNL